MARTSVLMGMLAAMVIALAGAAQARPTADPVDLSVVDRETGQVLRIWRHHGREYVAGRPGARYALRVTNRTGGRVLVVMSVDGVNILTGETAGYDQRGYVFDPYETYDLTGWRKSLTEVAAFTFAPMSRSYAARTGRPGEVGVIGIAVFKERARPPAYYPEASEGLAEPSDRAGREAPAPPPLALAKPAAPAGRAAPPADIEAEDQATTAQRRRDERLGTAHGAREWSQTTLVDFERATPWPQLVRQIEYDTWSHLVAAGVIPTRTYPDHRPRAFPTQPETGGWVPDPPGGGW
jgi:hypothetical protein